MAQKSVVDVLYSFGGASWNMMSSVRSKIISLIKLNVLFSLRKLNLRFFTLVLIFTQIKLFMHISSFIGTTWQHSHFFHSLFNEITFLCRIDVNSGACLFTVRWSPVNHGSAVIFVNAGHAVFFSLLHSEKFWTQLVIQIDLHMTIIIYAQHWLLLIAFVWRAEVNEFELRTKIMLDERSY